ncbi:predicted protein [Lichtheimia corymbifera JMRC:FSU:9682]|uniref:Uncharacterized protein n=1 Tax=Lichtheimia corymbifera JMRC:FSU:9682 TaxID=1263082 RepID=A0A068S503_9FUNG|nr:predicted protein [Lichtheimia corymbifera JMRC:FSU:9682]
MTNEKVATQPSPTSTCRHHFQVDKALVYATLVQEKLQFPTTNPSQGAGLDAPKPRWEDVLEIEKCSKV